MAYDFKRVWRCCKWCGELLEISAGDGIPLNEDDPEAGYVCGERCKEGYEDGFLNEGGDQEWLSHQ